MAEEKLTGLRNVRAALARMAAALRGVVGTFAVVSALLGVESPVSMRWIVPAVVLVFGWASLYVWVSWTKGLRAWLVLVDLLFTGLLCLAIGKLVPASSLPGTVSWVSVYTSNNVVSAQLGGRPGLSVPGCLFVASMAVTGARLGHSPDGGVPLGVLFATQSAVAAAVMAVALRTEQSAVTAFADLQEAQQFAALAAIRREDERTQLRFLHNGPLTTLAMALDAGESRPSAILRRQASEVLETLSELAADPVQRRALVRLDERLARLIGRRQPRLRITADLQECSAPSEIAEAFARAVSEALENVARHAGSDRAVVELRYEEPSIRVTITDQGPGFDTARRTGYGLREDIVGRMAAVGGTAMVLSAPGSGTIIFLEWQGDEAPSDQH